VIDFLLVFTVQGPNYKKNLMTILRLTNILSQTYDKVTIVPDYKRICDKLMTKLMNDKLTITIMLS